jgi:glutamate racemase
MIGVFDSGVGGLSVLAEIRRELPDADVVYLADQARAPYGVKTLEEVATMSEQVSRWLMDKGASTITIACNTASAAALIRLRALYQDVAFVGMEPAVKPAALTTSTGVIGVLATAATFQGELFASVVQRHAEGLTVVTRACPRWVELVESGLHDGPEVQVQVERCLSPLLEAGADTLVLGCTHFPFLTPVIERIAGPGVTVVDPAPAVARQVRRIARVPRGSGRLLLATSGDPARFEQVAYDLAGIETEQPVLACTWNDN